MGIDLRVLHFSDLHWDEEHEEDQTIVIEQMIHDATRISKDKKIDVVVFSGDLVNKGQNALDFNRANALIFEKVKSVFGIVNEDIFLCPGNHDIDRKSVTSDALKYVEGGLKSELVGTSQLNKHIDRFFEASLDQDQSNARLKNYFEFVRGNYNKNSVLQNNYVDCVIRKSDFGDVGFALFNTAWRSIGAGETERNQLLLAERVVDKAAEHLKDCVLKIGVMHHPLDWLAPWASKAIRAPLLKNFNVALFGHIHEAMPTLVQNVIGDCVFAQCGCLYQHREYYNGYQLIDISADDGFVFSFNLRTWFNEPRRGFGPAENLCDGGKKQYHLKSSDANSRKLEVQELVALQAAFDEYANLQARTLQLDSNVSFDTWYTPPRISHRSDQELLELRPSAYKKHLLDIGTIISNDGVHVFVGARQSGKSTLLTKIAKEVLHQQSRSLRIPIIVDFVALKKYDTVEKITRRHFTALHQDIVAARVLKNHRCVFIVDNVSFNDLGKLDNLIKLIAEHKDHHDWYLFADQVDFLGASDIKAKLGTTNEPVFIQPFSRGDIRELVTKSSPHSGQKRGIDFDTVIKLMEDNNLPRNPYMVALLVSVISNMAIDATVNEATLLDKLIDLLLNKQSPANIYRSPTDFGGQNILLEQIARWLSENDNYLAENDILGRLAQYFSERGIRAGAAELLNYFINVGILEKIDEQIRFRFRSFGAYFLARYAERQKDYAPKLLENLAIINFWKEFSLLCDLSRNDAALLEYLEVIIEELQPRLYREIDKAGLLKASFRSDFNELAEGVLEDISNGPQPVAKIDEKFDFQDRAKRSLITKMRDDFKLPIHDGLIDVRTIQDNLSPDDEKDEFIQTVLNLAGYFAAWKVWGRALTSLDFLQLSVRKPSFLKLLDHWSRIAATASLVGDEFFTEILTEAKNKGEEYSKKIKGQLEYLVRVHLPLMTAQEIFAHIGAGSTHQLLTATFDELDLQSPEALGAACLLIRQKPYGWDNRVKRYIDAVLQRGKKNIVQYFLLEALHKEYYTRQLNLSELSDVEQVIAFLLEKAGMTDGKSSEIVRRFEQNRPQLEAVWRELRR